MKALFFKRCEGSILMEICFQGGTGFHVVSDNLVCFFHLVSRQPACRPSRSVSRQVVSRIRDCRTAGHLPCYGVAVRILAPGTVSVIEPRSSPAASSSCWRGAPRPSGG